LISLILAACIASVPLLVYYTGGIKYVYSHSLYIPILLAGLIFGAQGGVLAGLLGGLALGPAIPISVETGEAQAAINWLYRTGFFTLIGFLSGTASNGARAHLQRITWLSRHDPATGLPNRVALIDRLDNPKASD